MYRLAIMHSVTDRLTDGRTDRHTDHASSRYYCMQYDRLKTVQCVGLYTITETVFSKDTQHDIGQERNVQSVILIN